MLWSVPLVAIQAPEPASCRTVMPASCARVGTACQRSGVLVGSQVLRMSPVSNVASRYGSACISATHQRGANSTSRSRARVSRSIPGEKSDSTTRQLVGARVQPGRPGAEAQLEDVRLLRSGEAIEDPVEPLGAIRSEPPVQLHPRREVPRRDTARSVGRPERRTHLVAPRAISPIAEAAADATGSVLPA